MYYFTEDEKRLKKLPPEAIGSFESLEDVLASGIIKGHTLIDANWYRKYPYNNQNGNPDIFGDPSIIYGTTSKYIGSVRWYVECNFSDRTFHKYNADYFDVSVVLKDKSVSNHEVLRSLEILKGKIKYNIMVLACMEPDNIVFDYISRDGKYVYALCHTKKAEKRKYSFDPYSRRHN